MSQEAIAEFLLSLTSPAESASATVGDLLEQAKSRGSLWFWIAILETAVSQTLRELFAAIWNLALAAFSLWWQFLGRTVQLAAGAYLLWAIIYLADNHTALELLTTSLGTRVRVIPPAWIAYNVGVGVLPVIAGWMKGREAAGKAVGYEIPLWIAVVLVWSAMGSATKLPLWTITAPPVAFLGGMLRMRWLGLRPSHR